MKKFFPELYDYPERTMSMAGIAYGVICFYTLPFLMLFFSGGFEDAASQSWFEVVYHCVNFFVTLWLFRHYLKDSFFNVRYNLKPFLKTVFICTDIMIAYSIIFFTLAMNGDSENMRFASSATLPLVEMELFNLSSNLVFVNPIAGTICTVILAPVIISCIYYASAFAPVCRNHPLLAYLVLIIALAVPRALNALTFWPLEEEILLYLAQLPLHLVACYAYQKADTVWAPIAVLTVTNVISSVFFLIML